MRDSFLPFIKEDDSFYTFEKSSYSIAGRESINKANVLTIVLKADETVVTYER